MFIHPIETTRLKNRFDFLCKEAKPLCGGLLEDDSGMLTCPPFSAEPNYYDNNVDCQWLIQGLTHQNILFQFHEFSTEPGRDIVTVGAIISYIFMKSIFKIEKSNVQDLLEENHQNSF